VPLTDPVSGKRSWMYYTGLPSVGWSLGIIFPEDELFETIRKLTNKTVIIAMSGILLLAMVIIVVSGNITRPLRMLALTTAEIARGNLDISVPQTQITG